MKDISFEGYAAILGIFLTILEIYFHNFSVKLEEALDTFWKKIKHFQSSFLLFMSKYRCALKGIASNLLREHALIAGVPAILAFVSIAVFETNLKDHSSPKTWLFFVLMGPYFLLAFLWVFFFLFSIASLWIFYIYVFPSVYIANKILHFINMVGRGKAIGGIGILLAVYGLFTADWHS